MTKVGFATNADSDTIKVSQSKRTTTYAYVESVDRYGDGALISLGCWSPKKSLETYKDFTEVETDEVFSLQVDAKKIRKKYLTDHRGFKEGLWLEVEFNRTDGYEIIGDDQLRTVRFQRKLSNSTSENKKLRRLFSFIVPPLDFQLNQDSTFIHNFEVIDGLIEQQTELNSTHPHLKVYNIGQGLCCSLNRTDGSPYSYFDFGYGVHARTTFLSTQRCKLVVLSHWHADHYRSYQNNRHVLSVPWLVPYVPVLSPPARLLLQLLQTVYVMRHNVTVLNFPFFSVSRVAGIQRGGNNVGQAVEAKLKRHDQSNVRIFIPGDADYDAITFAPTGVVDCLVATHHGADVRGGNEPLPASVSSLIVYSAAQTIRPNHPRPTQVGIYNQRGWTRRADTINGDIKISLNTTPLVVALLPNNEFLI